MFYQEEDKWLHEFSKDFHKRFLSLLSYEFKKFQASQALSIIEAAEQGEGDETTSQKLTKEQLDLLLSPFDLKRLDSYANNLLDYHVIVDMLPLISQLFFSKKLGKISVYHQFNLPFYWLLGCSIKTWTR